MTTRPSVNNRLPSRRSFIKLGVGSLAAGPGLARAAAAKASPAFPAGFVWGAGTAAYQIEGAPAELYRPAVDENFAAMRQDPETAELDARRRFRDGIHDDRL